MFRARKWLYTVFAVVCLWHASDANAFEVFAKGSVSKNNLDVDKYITSLSATTGFAFAVFSFLRVEARYTNTGSIQNRLEFSSSGITVALSDIKTTTSNYSLGLDIEFLGERSAFQPFIFLGAGYIETERSYYFSVDGGANYIYAKEPKKTGVSGNGGIGFRVRVAKSLAIEIEAYAYGIDIHKPNPLINLYGTAGVRIFL